MQAQGLESLEDFADARQALAIHGRYGDTLMGHLTPGEMVLPRPIADDPILKRQLFDAFERHEINPHQYQVGHFENSINPLTGAVEFSFFKKVGAFLKKAAPIIGQVVGYAYGGPTGAAIGGGIGGAVKEGDMGGAIKGAAQGYVGGNIAQGAGITGGGGISSLWGQGAPGAESMWTFGANPTTDTGVGAFFQNTGANLAGVMGQNPSGATIPKMGDSFNKLGTFQKMGAAGLGLAALGGFEKGENTAGMPGPSGEQGGYLQRGLTPATLPTQYGTQGVSSGSTTPAGINSALTQLDPVTAAYLDSMKEDDYSKLMFPEFNRVNVNKGGLIEKYKDKDYSDLEFPEFLKARQKSRTLLMDGGALPELDLRNVGGSITDSNGAGNRDTVDAKLADGEFVMTKQAVRGIGNGNHAKGIELLYAGMNANENKAAAMGLGRA